MRVKLDLNISMPVKFKDGLPENIMDVVTPEIEELLFNLTSSAGRWGKINSIDAGGNRSYGTKIGSLGDGSLDLSKISIPFTNEFLDEIQKEYEKRDAAQFKKREESCKAILGMDLYEYTKLSYSNSEALKKKMKL